jgi:hypothetical protein
VITDVYCPYGYMLDVYGCQVCAPGGSGGNGSGGATGKGGAGGSASGGTSGALDGGQDGVIVCGKAICAAGEYCCNVSCNSCAPAGYTCLATVCSQDAGTEVDSNGCTARPESDAIQCGGSYPPHFYTCILTMLPAPCKTMSIGDVTNTFCCP